MKTGPNDVSSGVVWDIGKYFFFFHVFFFSILTVIFSSYSCSTGTGWLIEGSNEENGPKRRVQRRLGHW